MPSVKLSIITPVFNAQPFVERFLQRVIDQNCPFIEHIIIDGASEDGTLRIVQEYARRFPHIRWASEKDSGPGEAINKGIALARGEFMGVLCLDDYYEPGILNEVVPMLHALPKPAFLVGICRVFGVDRKLLYVNKPTGLTPNGILIGCPYPNNPVAYFYSKSIHERAGLYSTTDHYAVDLDFLLRCFSVAKVKYLDKVIGNFQLLETSYTQRATVSGSIEENTQKAIERYLKGLPWPQRAYIAIAKRVRRIYRKYFRYYLNRLGFYLSHPKEITQITARWRKIRNRSRAS